MARSLRRIIERGDSHRVAPADLLDSVLPDIGDTGAKASAFWVLLTCSSIIAAAGVLTNSTAVVIGAMVIAPLGTPIYGVAAALVSGARIRGVLAQLTLGIIAAIAIGALVDLATLEKIALEYNPQISSRTNPSLIDLGVAFATGIAGSMALVRLDISPALPGVAIAISLVPPLTVVGITLAHAEWELAGGAMLLFVTNMLAIVLAGLLVFGSAGLTSDDARPVGARRHSRAVLTVTVALVMALLGASSIASARLIAEEQRVTYAAQRWDDDHRSWTLKSVERVGDHIEVTYLGSSSVADDRPTADALRSLGHDVETPVTIDLVDGAELTLQ